MTSSAIAKSRSFHLSLDSHPKLLPSSKFKRKGAQGTTIERKLTYRFHLHQHPFLQSLIQRLIQKGVRGMQAVDTEYAAGEISLPNGVDVALGDDTIVTVPQGARIGLLKDVSVNGKQLEKGTELLLYANAEATLDAGSTLRLVDAMHATPKPRCELKLEKLTIAALLGDTRINFNSDVQVTHTGGAVTLKGPAEVVLAAHTEIRVPKQTTVMILRRRMRPVGTYYADFFGQVYVSEPLMLRKPYPIKELDFSSSGAYSVYNWELFYHVPLTIAVHLSKNQRFAEAQRWFHYLFDPTDNSQGSSPERFWKVRPFQSTDVKKVEELLVNLVTAEDLALNDETIRSFESWEDAPFRPHVVARDRPQAYMYKTVMAYLDNLIAWGDSLFRQDTGEAVDEAMMLYVLAANILGPRPLPVPRKGSARPQTYDSLRMDLAAFGTVMRDLEPVLPFDLSPFPAPSSGGTAKLASLRSLGKALYFSVPPNRKLLDYWDTVADRLFKIRNSLNLKGVFRQLAQFEPPIDPVLLVRATAAGLDVAAIVNGLNQPLPLVRFAFLVQKAAEIAQEVKSLGNNLLSAMEKEDGEAMTLLRAKHERVVMAMVEQVKYSQLQEAIKAKEGLMQSMALARQRYIFYERQLGKQKEDIEKAIPDFTELERDSLQKFKFDMQEPTVELREIDVNIAEGFAAEVAGVSQGGKLLSSHEVRESLFLEAAQLATDVSNVMNIISAVIHPGPDLTAINAPAGTGTMGETGPSHLGWSFSSTAAAARTLADRFNFEARRASRIDTFARRERDWAFQSNLAAGEIMQIFKQIRAAELRQAIADQELKSHRQQMKHAEEIERFLNEEGTDKKGKKTNKALYAWMKREVKGLYAQCFQFAFDIAKKAERALQHELGNQEQSYLQFGYLAGKEGLLAGEKLYLDIKRMEMAYHEQNQREYELTKHVSLLQVNAPALVQLRTTGRCSLSLPEPLFDMDGPGHYYRRIKSVALSIPCVAGPYASVNCTLTLLKSSIRKSAILEGNQYGRLDAEDARFSDNFSSLQSIVTSTGQNDSGLFETNLRDERYLPFENSGVISEWQLQLPADPREKHPTQFDYNTISDVILHLRYTAREGGAMLRNGALAQWKT